MLELLSAMGQVSRIITAFEAQGPEEIEINILVNYDYYIIAISKIDLWSRYLNRNSDG